MKLEAKGVSFKHELSPDWILRDYNLEVKTGEVVGLFGPSGVGKTTLAKLLAGYEKPTEGKIIFNEGFLPQKGFCPVQLVFQHPELSVNPRWPIKKVLSESGQTDSSLLDLLGISRRWQERYPHELSGGELQRVALARALTPKTRFIIADEITAMLDAITQAQIWHALLNFSKENRLGLFVISHNLVLLERLCTRIEHM